MHFFAVLAHALVLSYLTFSRFRIRTFRLGPETPPRQHHSAVRGMGTSYPLHLARIALVPASLQVKVFLDGGFPYGSGVTCHTLIFTITITLKPTGGERHIHRPGRVSGE